MEDNTEEKIEDKLNLRKKEFLDIITKINEIMDLKEKTNKSITKINDLYLNLIKDNNDPYELLGLDFFNFQYNFYKKQFENQNDLLDFLNNRVYKDYFKLQKNLVNYVQKDLKNEDLNNIVNSNNNFENYKDLDDKKTYSIEVLKTINIYVLNILDQLLNLTNTNKKKIEEKNKLQENGLSVGNFVLTLKYKNEQIINIINLFYNYLKYFHKNYMIILNQIYERLDKINGDLNSNIDFKKMNNEEN